MHKDACDRTVRFGEVLFRSAGFILMTAHVIHILTRFSVLLFVFNFYGSVLKTEEGTTLVASGNY